MIKTAAQILAEVRRSGTEFGAPVTQYDASMQTRRRPGRPQQHRHCKATKFGPCFQPLTTEDHCKGHALRLRNYGDPYAGKKTLIRREWCKWCHRQMYLRVKMTKGKRWTVVCDHELNSGRTCPGSGHAPVQKRRDTRR